MIDLKKTYTTRNGREVKLLAILDGPLPVKGAIRHSDGWLVYEWTDGGACGFRGSDLIEAKPRHTTKMWLSMYRWDNGGFSAFGNSTLIEAKINNPMALAIVPVEIEFTEGDGL